MIEEIEIEEAEYETEMPVPSAVEDAPLLHMQKYVSLTTWFLKAARELEVSARIIDVVSLVQ